MDFDDPGQFGQAQFDDPALKGALRRTIGKQTAPAEFRERMQQMLGASSVVMPRQMSRARSLFLGFAAAAVVLLSVALVAVQLKNYVLTPTTAVAPASLPDTLASTLITTHDKCLAAADHHIVSATDSAALATTLTNDLGFKVTVPTVASEWTFKGAGECRVGNYRTAHMLYSRGQTNISVFALPTEAVHSCGSSSYYETVSNKHPIIGYASSESLYALVGSDSSHELSMSEMQAIASQFKGCGPAGCGAGATVAVIAR